VSNRRFSATKEGLARALIMLVKAYRLLFSPWLGGACRFTPSCSQYSLEALQAYGAAAGTYLTLRRVARCHPWCSGGRDPLPARAPRMFFSSAQRGACADSPDDGIAAKDSPA
jgi:putative membrane protein insertion efficiency factor